MRAFTFTRNDFLVLDGGMGTQLQAAGMQPGEIPEARSILTPEIVTTIHENYLQAGAQVVYANTFGLNRLKLKDSPYTVEEVAKASLQAARTACDNVAAQTGIPRYVALDLGPTGRLLKPVGDLGFEECVDIYAQVIRAAAPLCDLIAIETMTDPYEMKAAVLAAKENCDLPILATVAVDENGRLLSGLEVEGVVALLEGLRVGALGLNCGADPRVLKPFIQQLVAASSLPVVLKLNAGIPHQEGGKTVFDMAPEAFGAMMREYAALGVQGLGGCCGTTPAHIAALKKAIEDVPFTQPTEKEGTLLCSFGQWFEAKTPIIIGERINPTGKKNMQQALRQRDFNWMRKQAIAQEEQGAHMLDVNVGLPDINESAMMADVVRAVQEVCALPLQIDASKPEVLESGLRAVNGKAMINSVSGKKDILASVLPLVAKYGGVIAGLTLDDQGIPETAEGRLKVAEKIVNACLQWGIPKKDIVIDPLCMTISADSQAANTTIQALRLIKEKLGVKTMLGVSNISFGLPNRQMVNAAFFTLALQAGLDFAIINPGSDLMMSAYDATMLLTGRDEGARQYIHRQSGREISLTMPDKPQAVVEGGSHPLTYAVLKGLKDDAVAATKDALKSMDAMAVINDILIPALNLVGDDFAKGTLFLPQLMMSADASAAAFEVVRALLPTSGDGQGKGTVIVATVKGDIHDIGKNIVRALLENYGFRVLDLGKDVAHEAVVEACQREHCKLVGLSALMTTTVDSMRETIRLLRSACPDTKIMVGGAVLTKDYAAMIDADFYAKGAMDSVHYAQEILG